LSLPARKEKRPQGRLPPKSSQSYKPKVDQAEEGD